MPEAMIVPENTIGLNEMVERQSKGSRFALYRGSLQDLPGLATRFMANQSSVRAGVVTIQVPHRDFLSSVVRVTDRVGLAAGWFDRPDLGYPVIGVWCPDGPRVPARKATLTLYSRDVLGERATAKTDWEIVAFTATALPGGHPADPVTRASDYLGNGWEGSEQSHVERLIESALFWSVHVPPKIDHFEMLSDEDLLTLGSRRSNYTEIVPGVVKGVAGPFYLAVWSKDNRYEPKADAGKKSPPPHPARLGLRFRNLESGGFDFSAKEVADSILYWATHPLRSLDFDHDTLNFLEG